VYGAVEVVADGTGFRFLPSVSLGLSHGFLGIAKQVLIVFLTPVSRRIG
jgi:hypothetical protein